MPIRPPWIKHEIKSLKDQARTLRDVTLKMQGEKNYESMLVRSHDKKQFRIG